MQIVQTTFGVFHSFELAHQLHQRQWLRKIYTTWPWARIQREGLPRELVGTFPYIHTPDYLLGRTRLYPVAAEHRMRRWNAVAFDAWTSRVIPECDALIAISGTSLNTGALVQSRGGKFLCDRGSSHHRFQEQIVREEHARWGVLHKQEAPGVIERDEALYAIADAITVPSTFAARTFVQLGVPAEKLHVIPYGVRLERFQPTGSAPDIRGRFEILFAGHVSLRKGIPYLLQAFARVQHPHKRLRIAGAIDARLEAILSRFPTEHVEFLGPVPQARLPELFSTSHLLVLPSIEEGLALVQAQAMACGCPVLASTNTGAEDLFTDERDGFIVPIRDVDVLVDRMERLIQQPGLQTRLSEASLNRVKALGGWDYYGDRWAQLLRTLTCT
jgi:glycosyltransferase involved in cell wall biosynthesis